MEKPVNRGREYDADISNEDYTAEQSIKRRKYFAAGRTDIRHRSHSAQNHTGIMHGIYPGNIC